MAENPEEDGAPVPALGVPTPAVPTPDADGVPVPVSEKDKLQINITEPTPMPAAEEYEDTLPGDVPDPPSGTRHRPDTEDTAPLPALSAPKR